METQPRPPFFTAKSFWLIAFLGLVAILLYLPRSPLPWFDEFYFASAALGVVRGGRAVPTTFAAFPHVGRLDLLYGPVIPFLGSWQIRLFGLSAASWRLLGFGGAVGCVLSAAWVGRRLDRSPAAAAAIAMIVSLSQGMGQRAASGRLDAITVTLELLSLGCILTAMQAITTRSSALFALLAGLSSSLAALSTPRSFPFVLGLSAALVLELALARNSRSLQLGAIFAVSAFLPILAWTFSEGMTPLGWLRLIASGSQGDQINVSPLLHGSWQLFSGPFVFSGLLLVFVMLMVSRAAWVSKVRLSLDERDTVPSLRLAAVTVMINYLVLLALISRFWEYEIFELPLLAPVLMALTAKVLRIPARRSMRRVVLASWIVLAIYLITVRSARIGAWLASYKARDPQPLQAFVQGNVPAHSRVFGPVNYYFYAVEAAGSDYLFVVPMIIPTAIAGREESKIDWREQLRSGQPVYLIWPRMWPVPPGISLKLQASFEEGTGPSFWVSGYPLTDLYRVAGTTESQGRADESSKGSG